MTNCVYLKDLQRYFVNSERKKINCSFDHFLSFKHMASKAPNLPNQTIKHHFIPECYYIFNFSASSKVSNHQSHAQAAGSAHFMVSLSICMPERADVFDSFKENTTFHSLLPLKSASYKCFTISFI